MEELERLVEAAVADYLARPKTAGLAVGVVAGDKARIFTFGVCDRTSQSRVGADTLFEIASITKVFSAALLAEMALRGEVRLEDPVDEYLPDDARGLRRGREPVRLVHLATHSSSLPRLPPNFWSTVKDRSNPYAHYHEADLLDAVRAQRLGRPIGRKVEYSNYGYGLLGFVLSRRLGTGYGEAIRQRILEPLGMSDTAVTLDEDQTARFATGHDAKGAPTSHWDSPGMPGGGALRSSVSDMLKFLRANLEPSKTPVGQALAACQERHSYPSEASSPAWTVLAAGLALLALALQLWGVVVPGNPGFLAAFLVPILVAGLRTGLATYASVTLGMLLGSSLIWGDRFAAAYALLIALAAGYLTGSFHRPSRGGLPLAWQTTSLGPDGAEAIWHNGGTGGFASFCAVVRSSGVGVVLLSNAEPSVDEIGLRILRDLHRTAKASPT
jgi:CubicO group peptidase (beta-lactamase class C family)